MFLANASFRTGQVIMNFTCLHFNSMYQSYPVNPLLNDKKEDHI